VSFLQRGEAGPCLLHLPQPLREARLTDQTEAKGYKVHQAGSRKGRVHHAFDEQDADVAFALGQQLGLKPSTLRTWFNHWRRTEKPSQPKQAAKPKGKKDGKAKGRKVEKTTKEDRGRASRRPERHHHNE